MNRVLFLGSPGLGKSTLLNMIFKHHKFQAKHTFDSGVTRAVHWELNPDDNTHYGDTPGWFDALKREEAAVEIEKGLKAGGAFRIIFFLDLGAGGRPNPTDIAGIKVVCNALAEVPNLTFGILGHRVQLESALQALRTSGSPGSIKHKSLLEAALGAELLPKLSSEYFLAAQPDWPKLQEEDPNWYPPFDQGFADWIHNLPPVTIKVENVAKVKAEDISAFAEAQEMLQSKLDTLVELYKAQQEDNKKRIQELEARNAEYQRRLEQNSNLAGWAEVVKGAAQVVAAVQPPELARAIGRAERSKTNA